MSADELTLGRSGDVNGQPQSVVFVRLVHRAVVPDPQEVQFEVEVRGREVGEAQRGRLVRDAERIPEVLDSNVAVGLGRREKLDGLPAGHEHRRGEVVDLETLLKEVGIGGRGGVFEHPMSHGLQCHAPKAVPAGNRGRGQVDAAVLEVGHRACGVRQIVDVNQFESEVLRHHAHRSVGERTRRVPDIRQEFLGDVIDVGEVVVELSHLTSEVGVDASCLLGCGDRLPRASREFAVQADKRLKGLVGHPFRDPNRGQPQRGVDRGALCPVELDLERGAF